MVSAADLCPEISARCPLFPVRYPGYLHGPFGRASLLSSAQNPVHIAGLQPEGCHCVGRHEKVQEGAREDLIWAGGTKNIWN
jgi:hypothetical protein